MAFNIERIHADHKTRWPNLDGKSSIEAWRKAKELEDSTVEKAEEAMTDAFGCHGEPIASAISEAIWELFDLLPEAKQSEAKRLLTVNFQAICNRMTYVRSDLDELIDKMANDQRQEGWNEAVNNLPSSCDLQARDYGVTLDSSLEDAFEKGIDSVSGCLDDCYPESVCVSMDDL